MSGLANVVVATIAFVGTHFLMSHSLRPGMAGRLGERGFLGLYSLISLLTFGWMVGALRVIGPEPFLWTASEWAWPVATLLMLAASILLAGSLIGNPAFPGMPGNKGEPRGVLAITRHPMMWAFAIWAVVHGAIWPQPSVLILCAGILILALGGAVGQDAKKTRLQSDSWPAWRATTSYVPFAGPASARAMWPGWGVLVGGILLWLAATWMHPLLGAPVVGVWR